MTKAPAGGFLAGMRARQERVVADRRRRRSERALEALCARRPVRGFAGALRRPAGEPIRVIAEIKKASPSAGRIRDGFDPLHLARTMVRGGAAALSVLTEEEHFHGSLTDLARVSAGVPVPVMRKDFIVDRYQLLEARAAGASACLLIAAMLSPGELHSLAAAAAALGLETLIEAHDAADVRAALDAGAPVVGINNRNLKTLKVDTGNALSLREEIPPGVVVVAESGYRFREDLVPLEEAGVDAVLVGEAIMRSDDATLAVAGLRGPDAPPPPLWEPPEGPGT